MELCIKLVIEKQVYTMMHGQKNIKWSIICLVQTTYVHMQYSFGYKTNFFTEYLSQIPCKVLHGYL